MTRMLGRAGWVMAAIALWAGPARAELVDRVAAVVNGEVITLSEVEERAAPELAKVQVPRAERAKVRDQLMHRALDVLIGEKLMDAQVKELGLTITDAELDAAITDVRQQNGWDEQQFAQALRQEGYSVEAYRDFMRKHLSKLKLVNFKVRANVKVSEEDLRAEYANYAKRESQDAEIHARHILVQLKPNAKPDEVDKARKKAEALAAEARKPGVDFEKLAKAKSEGSSAADGGDLGFFRKGVMVPAFEEVAFKLKEGEVSDPVRTNFGFHVIKVVERRAVGAVPFDEVKDQLREQLTRARMEKATEDYVLSLRSQAVVEVKL